MNKEQTYDAAIAPLVTQIIGICQQHGIAMVASFAIPTIDDPGLVCTSLLPDGEGKPNEAFQKCASLIRFGHAPQVVAITLTRPAAAHN